MTSEIRLRLTITDAMSFWDDSLGTYLIPDSSPRNTQTYWFRIPSDWLEGGTLPARRRGQICAHIYGEDWLYASERSKYAVVTFDVHILDAVELAQRVWQAERRGYVAAPTGGFIEVGPDAF